MQDKKIKALDDRIAELQKQKAVLILEKEIEAVKNSTVVPRIIYQDVYVPRIVTYPVYTQPAIGPYYYNNGGFGGATGTNGIVFTNASTGLPSTLQLN